MAEGREEWAASWTRLHLARKYFSPAAVVLATIYWWSAPLVWFPPSWFWPWGYLLSKPGFPIGAISAASWAALCLRATKRLAAVVEAVT